MSSIFFANETFAIGRDNRMIIGVAALSFSIGQATCSRSQSQAAKIKENRRASLTVDTLAELIDQEHLKQVMILQWIGVLTTYIPS
ncbi:hypothetical protein HGRIS_011095 [Hohenbuehelia grisea]|uniref:Uncharacterized protein n=1 Tax=Hohenbuehelia grisea TaxID=104357 RepID=A0ABR3IZM4_9AGAR